MTTSQPSHPGSLPDGNQSLKRRGLFAAAWAAVAAFIVARTSVPVEASQVALIYENAPAGAPLNAPGATVLMIGRSDFNLGAGSSVLESDGGGKAGLSGILGISTDSNGVRGRTLSGNGVFGQVPSNSSSNAIAVYGQNYSTYAGPSPGAGGFAVYGLSAKGHGLVGATATAGGAAVVGATNGVAGAYAAAFYGPVIIGGNFTVVGGAKSAAVPHPDGSHRRMYCVESPESWFEDFGKGQLDCGQATVQIDPDFAAVVDLEDYQVFLTEYGQHSDLCVADQTPTGFRVQAKDDAASGRFGWRILAKRKDIKGVRLETVEIPPEPVLPPPLPDPPERTTARRPSESR